MSSPPEFLFCPVYGTGESMRLTVRRWLARHRSAFQEITIVDTVEFGRCLLLDGVMQAAESDHDAYDDGLLARLDGSERRLLVLGGGDGFVARRAVTRLPEVSVTVVEIDGDVARLCDESLNPGVYSDPRIELRIEDAAEFVARAPAPGEPRFDGAVVDLTDVPLAVKASSVRSFYERVIEATCRCLADGAWLSVQSGTPEASGPYLALPPIVDEILRTHTGNVVRQEVYLPSYGEPAVFLSTRKR